MPPPRNTFRKSERLCGRLRLKEVATTGRAVNEPPFRLVGKMMQLPTDAPAQVAFAVPSRSMRRAVQRNRMKRLMREAYRTGKHDLHERLRAEGRQCAWLFIFQGREPVSQEETRQRITRALSRWMEQHG
ncbi:MAG: ribonuclease P protein component [Flavobacteriales bacterium]|jgi:ribonuclease P protein component|nr:MAG: ribonuclease P protein component [Flavobacteriales bacterium]